MNLVELLADDDECVFDQPCAHGHRVVGHAVYCHNTEWADSPRKCRRTLYTGGRIRDEDCAGFAPNPLYQAAAAKGEHRPCTCHPNDNPPAPCPRRYALSECREAALAAKGE